MTMSKSYRLILGALALSALLLSGCAGERESSAVESGTVAPSPSAAVTETAAAMPSAAESNAVEPAPSAAANDAVEPVPSAAGTEVPDVTPAASEPSAEPAQNEPSEGSIAFEATDMDGNTVTADVFSQSKLSMVNVWATYCGPCLNEMPSLGELAAEYEPEEFQLIGIVSDVMEGDDQTYVESLIEETGANYTHLLLNESLYYALLTDVSVVPTTFFVDQEGTVLGAALGARDKTEWEELINGLLEEL